MNDYAEVFPPGEFLKDELEARGWSQTEFAEIIGRPVRLVNEIIAGKKSVTPETAIQLEASLGTSAEMWMNLESQYQLSKVRHDHNAIQRKAKLHEKFPMREMAKRGWIEASEDIDILEHQLLKFFRLRSLDEEISIAHAAKKSSYGEVTPLQWSWLCRTKQVAESFVVPKYNREALVEALPKLRTLLTAPEELRHVARILNEAGVRYVLVEALPGSKIDGACLWLNESQPVIAMSARLDRIDNFWFVLRHEIEHLIREHGKDKLVILDEDIAESSDSVQLLEEERVANDAASQFGVNDVELNGYMARVNPYFFARDRLLGFAMRVGVHPGIVVGRLQKKLEKTNYPEPYKYLREYLVKVRHIVSQSTPMDGWGNIYPIN